MMHVITRGSTNSAVGHLDLYEEQEMISMKAVPLIFFNRSWGFWVEIPSNHR
jgi:hypothetical protein